MLLKSASKINCLNTLLFLVFLALDAQARILPEITLNNDLIIVNNIAGRTSSQLPPSSTKSSPQPIKEIRGKSSSVFQIIIDIIGWDMISKLPPKALSPAEQQVEKTSGDDEIASPSNNLVPSTSTSSNIFLPSPGASVPGIPKFRKRSPPPAPPSSSSSTVPPSRVGTRSPSLTGTIPWPYSRHKSMAPSSLLVSPPKEATQTKPIYERPAHPPPIRPSSSKNDRLEDQMINGISNPSGSVISMITDRKRDPQVS